MKFEIENYKGQSIVYNDDFDKFECNIELNDKTKSTKRSSLNDVRKEIDTFIKLNMEFKPFKALFISQYGDDSFDPKLVSAIRSDGKFVVENLDKGRFNNKSYYGKEDMKRAMFYDIDIVKEYERLKKELELANDKFKEGATFLKSKLVPVDLSQYSFNDAS